MNNKVDVIIIGGGLAGLTAAIALLKKGFSVRLFEKNQFPKHKVCGEFISNEVLPYLKSLDLDIESLKPTTILETQLTNVSGKNIISKLPLGGFGISRYAVDLYLFEEAQNKGLLFHQNTIENVYYKDNCFTVSTETKETYTAKVVLGAYGKRSNIDKTLHRNFIQKKSPWLAVKAHYQGTFPNDRVGLFNFKGGYCDVSKVENNIINICYLVQYKSFQKYKNIADFQQKVLFKNPELQNIFKNSRMLYPKPLTISQISFENKPKVENHVLMIGDAAGLIHPLCGNGMAMAIHSGKLATDWIILYLNNEINRVELEKYYIKDWKEVFQKRMRYGKFLSKILLQPKLSEFVLSALVYFPFLTPIMIQKTHGKPF